MQESDMSLSVVLLILFPTCTEAAADSDPVVVHHAPSATQGAMCGEGVAGMQAVVAAVVSAGCVADIGGVLMLWGRWDGQKRLAACECGGSEDRE